MTIEEIQNQIVDEFSMYDDWMDKYAYLIEICLLYTSDAADD